MDKLLALEKKLKEIFLERDELIRGLFLSLLAGKHMLLIGPPGTGKSMLVNTFAERLQGAGKFSYLVTKYTRPEELIGAVSLKHLEKDEFKRVLTGKVADAHYVFLDEIFNCNSACANTILTIMNEGIYFNGTEPVKVPLVSLIGAANEVPAEVGGELAAFYDRFLLRYQLDYLQEESNMEKLLLDGEAEIAGSYFSLDEIKQWQGQAAEIQMPLAIVRKFISVVSKLRRAGVTISDRRAKESQIILKSNAFLSGRAKVTEEDMGVLQHIFWQFPEDKELVRQHILDFTTPLEKRVAQLLAEARQIKMKMDSTDSKSRRMAIGGEINLRLTEIAEEIKEVAFLWGEGGREEDFIRQALSETREIHQYIIGSCLGVAPEYV